MDLVSAISGLDLAQTMSAAQVSMAAKILDIQKSQGNAAIQLVAAASQGISRAGDALVAAATGMGGQLDTYA
jgi:hypothetical protein